MSDHITFTFTFLPPLCSITILAVHRWSSSSQSIFGSRSRRSWWYANSSIFLAFNSRCFREILDSVGFSVGVRCPSVDTLCAKFPKLSVVSISHFSGLRLGNGLSGMILLDFLVFCLMDCFIQGSCTLLALFFLLSLLIVGSNGSGSLARAKNPSPAGSLIMTSSDLEYGVCSMLSIMGRSQSMMGDVFSPEFLVVLAGASSSASTFECFTGWFERESDVGGVSPRSWQYPEVHIVNLDPNGRVCFPPQGVARF